MESKAFWGVSPDIQRDVTRSRSPKQANEMTHLFADSQR